MAGRFEHSISSEPTPMRWPSRAGSRS
jgi:hypothetical protein